MEKRGKMMRKKKAVNDISPTKGYRKAPFKGCAVFFHLPNECMHTHILYIAIVPF